MPGQIEVYKNPSLYNPFLSIEMRMKVTSTRETAVILTPALTRDYENKKRQSIPGAPIAFAPVSCAFNIGKKLNC